MMEMQIFLCQFLRKFDVELVEGQNVEVNPLITLRPNEPVSLRLKLRK